jgi:hypothetical protein
MHIQHILGEAYGKEGKRHEGWGKEDKSKQEQVLTQNDY